MEDSAANGADGEHNPDHIDRAFQSTEHSGEASHDDDSTKPFAELAPEVTKSFDEREPVDLHAVAPGVRDDTSPLETAERRTDADPNAESTPGFDMGSQPSTLPPRGDRVAPPDHHAGQFGKYELLERIGQGGWGWCIKPGSKIPTAWSRSR